MKRNEHRQPKWQQYSNIYEQKIIAYQRLHKDIHRLIVTINLIEERYWDHASQTMSHLILKQYTVTTQLSLILHALNLQAPQGKERDKLGRTNHNYNTSCPIFELLPHTIPWYPHKTHTPTRHIPPQKQSNMKTAPTTTGRTHGPSASLPERKATTYKQMNTRGAATTTVTKHRKGKTQKTEIKVQKKSKH